MKLRSFTPEDISGMTDCNRYPLDHIRALMGDRPMDAFQMDDIAGDVPALDLLWILTRPGVLPPEILRALAVRVAAARGVERQILGPAIEAACGRCSTLSYDASVLPHLKVLLLQVVTAGDPGHLVWEMIIWLSRRPGEVFHERPISALRGLIRLWVRSQTRKEFFRLALSAIGG